MRPTNRSTGTRPGTALCLSRRRISINAWFNYENNKSGTDLTLTFNMVGERWYRSTSPVSQTYIPSPYLYWTCVFSQKVSKRIIFKGYAKNVLNPAIKTVYANPQTGGKWYGNEYHQLQL